MNSIELLPVILGTVVAFVTLIVGFVAGRSSRPKLPPGKETLAIRSPEKALEVVAAQPAESLLPPVTEPKQTICPPVHDAAPSWHQRLVTGLRRTHGQLMRGIDDLFVSKDVLLTREQTLEGVFEALVQADVGVNTSEFLINRVRDKLTPKLFDGPTIKHLLKEEILAVLSSVKTPPQGNIENPKGKPHVVLMVGVNGVGKTTTTGKLAFKASQRGLRVAIGAADTFRAAAVEQLRIWSERSGATFVDLKEGSDPASVAFETVKVARQQELDLCIVDTAGRLHNRNDLMQELAKIRRVMSKEELQAPHEVLLVLDATTGQNALQQARVFSELVNITGLVLTKLDGTAKGGVAIGVVNELKVPIRYIGVGESVEDLEVFNAQEFADALFEEPATPT